MENVLWIGIFLPLIGALILMCTSFAISRGMTSVIGCSSILFSFLSFCWLLINYTAPFDAVLFHWIPISGIDADFALHIDPLALQMTMIITGVGFLIHAYATGYMEHDEDFARFFACLNFFVFSMLLLVLGSHILLVFVGWEGVGLASYLLIGFWYERPVAAQAATKAFVVNRIGDLGFLLAMLLAFVTFGTGDISQISQLAEANYAVGAPLITVLTLLFFIGAMGKSAQIPLHIWLADAMAGPTPVSALIHAATMVTAGVYLIVRLHVVFMLAPLTLQIVGAIGAATALFAALCALGQTDLKRVLAYSTVSQLGFMFLACGAGAFYSAMFHLTSHAFIKALLFLCAGNVLHMLHGTTEMGQMGGLSKYMPKTRWLFLIGVLALSGIPPFAGFFSKDLILDQEHLAGLTILYDIALVASVLTGFYLMRAYCLTFHGECHLDHHNAETVKEAPTRMLAPLVILALLSIFGGFLGYNFGNPPILAKFLAFLGLSSAEQELISSNFLTFETLVAVLCSMGGVIAAAVIYTGFVDRLGKTLRILYHSFYVDEIFWALIAVPFKSIANCIVRFVEPKVIDGSVNGVVVAGRTAAKTLQDLQSGQIRSYAAWMAVGAAMLLVYMIS